MAERGRGGLERHRAGGVVRCASSPIHAAPCPCSFSSSPPKRPSTSRVTNSHPACSPHFPFLPAAGKLAALAALLHGIIAVSRECCVVVSTSTAALDLVARLLAGPAGYKCVRIDGSTSVEARQQIVDSFNALGIGQVSMRVCERESGRRRGTNLRLAYDWPTGLVWGPPIRTTAHQDR